jgi:DNA ligase-1
MADLKDGETAKIQGSAKEPYILKNVGGVYSCSCIAWRNQSLPIDKRTCKHLKKYRGEALELARIGSTEAIKQKQEEEPTEKSPVLLAHSWDLETDITGWWMSEKLDGIRAYWDGKDLVSRLGNIFHAPDWYKATLPNFKLDGELWVGRKKFDETSSIVRRHNGEELWKKVSYIVFDAPEIKGSFENRIDFFKRHFENYPSDFAKVLHHEQCQGVEHLKSELNRVEQLGGEGMMLRQPQSLYESGRSHTLLKVKSMHDTEGVVDGYEPGKNKHKGKVGALWVKSNGVRFKIGTGLSDYLRSNPPKIGVTITYRYTEILPSGKPRFAAFLREKDVY